MNENGSPLRLPFGSVSVVADLAGCDTFGGAAVGIGDEVLEVRPSDRPHAQLFYLGNRCRSCLFEHRAFRSSLISLLEQP